MIDPDNPPFKLFDELEDAMSAQGSLYLGPNWRGFYMVYACAPDGAILKRFQFQHLVDALRAKGFSEGQDDADDFDSAFQVTTLRNWVGAPSQVLMVPHEQHEALVFAAEFIERELDPMAVNELDEYWDFQVAEAKAVWEAMSERERQEVSARVLNGRRFTKWDAAYAQSGYQELVEELLRD